MRLLGAGAVALLILVAVVAVASERLNDPTRTLVEGYDPSGNDFFANLPERTVLLRIRADFDKRDHRPRAVGELDVGQRRRPVAALPRPVRRQLCLLGDPLLQPGGRRRTPAGARDLGDGAYVRMGVSRGTVQVYRVTSAEISRVSELALDLEHPSDRKHYEARMQRIAGGLGLGLQ